MKTETICRDAAEPSVSIPAAVATEVPLSDEELKAWDNMVCEGRIIREPILKRHEERDLKMPEWRRKLKAEKSRKDSMKVIPVKTMRFVIMRMAGFGFKKAAEASGASWLDVQDARYHSEDFRCAIAAMEENSRQLMKARAQAIVEASQEEGTKVSMAQTQVSMMILKTLDRYHFGDDVGEKVADEVQKHLGGGGFVINLIGDAAKVAEAVPDKRPAKALVYTDC